MNYTPEQLREIVSSDGDYDSAFVDKAFLSFATALEELAALRVHAERLYNEVKNPQQDSELVADHYAMAEYTVERVK
jgi:hypothetical protein